MKQFIKENGFGEFAVRVLVVLMGVLSFGVFSVSVYGLGVGNCNIGAFIGMGFATLMGVFSVYQWNRLKKEAE